eukprot:Em0003g1651a
MPHHRSLHSAKTASREGSTVLNSSSSARLSSLSRSQFGSKTNLFSSSRKNLASESQRFHKSTPQILDENGIDVTPQSLLVQEPSMKKGQNSLFGEPAVPTDGFALLQSPVGTGGLVSSFMQPFSRSMFGSSTANTGSLRDSMSDDMMKEPSAKLQSLLVTRHVAPKAEEEPMVLTEEDLEKEVLITLSETETIWLMDIPATCVAEGSEELEKVKIMNENYEKLVKNHVGNDLYSDNWMQTIENPPKAKKLQTDEITTAEVGTYATPWDMYDTYQALQKPESLDDDSQLDDMSSRVASRMTSGASRRSRAPTALGVTMATALSVPGSATGSSVFNASTTTNLTLLSGHSSAMGKPGEVPSIDPTKPNDHPILKLDALRDSLLIMERAVTHNVYQPKQALYRNLPVIPDFERSIPSIPYPHLEKLWSYSCVATKGRSVTAIALNPANSDIVAVGYGGFSARTQGLGYICCWSLKNPESPERVYHAPSGVTSLNFSQIHPNLLAAGLYNGTLMLYNIRSTEHDFLLDSRDAMYKHTAPVWQVSWVVKERLVGEKSEVLVSISVDGRVLQWSIRKGFESLQLMKLKRVVEPKGEKKAPGKPKQAQVDSGQGGALISQHSPGMGFDFWSNDSNTYLVCTEEGYIHKCSCSYNEQFLETYPGHTGPVYRVKWSPFVPDVFLSCSADWTVKLWHQEYTSPLHSFQAGQKAINDICWSPMDSTLFGCVSEGRIEIWGMSHSILDPLLVHKPQNGKKQTAIQFSNNSNVVLVGDELGEVTVYLLKNIPKPSDHQWAAYEDHI